MILFSILYSLLFGSITGTVLTKYLLKRVSFPFFDTSIPGVTQELTNYKTFDLFEFVFIVIISISIFLLNWLLLKKNHLNKTISFAFLIAMFILYIQTHFVVSSGRLVLFIVVLIQALLLVVIRYPFSKINIDYKNKEVVVMNGILMGFYLLLLTKQMSTSVAIPLLSLLLLPVIYLLLSNRFQYFPRSPLHILILIVIVQPNSLTYLYAVGVFVICLILLLRKTFLPSKFEHLLRTYVYPITIIVLIAYNPLYYIGNFDTVEEGFWLGWIESMSHGRALYKDIASYHPPLLSWMLYLFTSVTEYSIRNVRLFFHALQIAGLVMFYFFVSNILSKKVSMLVVMIIILSIMPVDVRNNALIRVGFGLFSLTCFYWFMSTRMSRYLFISGLTSAVSIFVSMEVGISVTISIIITLVLVSVGHFRNILYYLAGLLMGSVPFMLYLTVTQSVVPFLEQMTFYMASFSKGYFNFPIERAIVTSNLRWHLIWQNFSNTSWLYELSKLTLLAVIMFTMTRVIKNGQLNVSSLVTNLSKVTSKNTLALSSSLFGLVLYRSVLGRSDYYHLLFVLFLSIPLLFYLFEKFELKPYFNVILITFLLFVVFNKPINEQFISKFLFKLTSYGEIIGDYTRYDLDRGKILVGKEVNVTVTNELVHFIKEVTSTDESIFVYPWNPEIYFLSDRKNATSIDTPYAFWNEYYQRQMVNQIEQNNPSLVILNTEQNFGGFTPQSLRTVYDYILVNYKEVKYLYPYKILVQKS